MRLRLRTPCATLAPLQISTTLRRSLRVTCARLAPTTLSLSRELYTVPPIVSIWLTVVCMARQVSHVRVARSTQASKPQELSQRGKDLPMHLNPTGGSCYLAASLSLSLHAVRSRCMITIYAYNYLLCDTHLAHPHSHATPCSIPNSPQQAQHPALLQWPQHWPGRQGLPICSRELADMHGPHRSAGTCA